MLTFDALSDTGRTITVKEVEFNAFVVAALLDYLRWLANQDIEFPLTAGHIWALYYGGVRNGVMWSEICEDIGLPVREDWT
jgi:hypothetical protein